MKQKSDLDDAREISAFLTYFKDNHTVVFGELNFLEEYITIYCNLLINMVKKK